MPRFPAEEWHVEQLRFTLFPLPTETVRAPAWWNFITQSEPDESAINAKRGSGLVKGVFGPGVLQLRMEPDRVEWVLGPPEPEPAGPTIEFTMPGAPFQLMDQFTETITRWFGANDVPQITRVAFGCVLAHSVTDRETGYVQLGDYVPVRIEPGSTDFFYQINRPHVDSTTGIANLKLNRLSRWSVAAHGFIMLNISQIESHARRELEDFFVRLELDINTISTYEGAIPRNRLADVCRELVQNAKTIAVEGVGQHAA